MSNDNDAAVDAVLQLEPHPSSVGSARRFLQATLARWCQPATVIEVAGLLTSELAGNAIRHGRGVVTVTARLRRDAVRVEVNDSSHDMPTRPPADPDRETGRGIWLVQALSSRWGAHVNPGDGKDVWFELDHDRSSR